MPLRLLLSATALALVLAGGAQAADRPAKPASQACFLAKDVNGFVAPDDQTVYVRVGVKDIYRLALFGPSPDIDWTQRIGLEARGSSWICSAMDATLIVPGPAGRQRIPVTSIHRLTPEEAAALPAKARP